MLDYNISLNFKYSECVHTHYQLNNTPNNEQLECIKYLVNNVLQSIRNNFGALEITSFFRSTLVNKMAKGAINSQHTKGQAVDFKCKNMKKVFYWIKDHLDFDQLIWEFGDEDSPDWIHLSFKREGNRKQCLVTYHDKQTEILI